MTRFLTPFILALAVLAGFTSCRSHPDLVGLSVELVKLERAADGSVMATIQVNNSTVLAYNISRSTHQVLLDGRVVGTVDIVEPLGLPAEHNLTQTAPLKLAAGPLTPGSATYQLNSSLTFVLSGESKQVFKLTNSGTVQVP